MEVDNHRHEASKKVDITADETKKAELDVYDSILGVWALVKMRKRQM